ncbi:hypothetical protein [Parasitella parasitica]|uniref:Retrotransposon gag domain-containing protein n=1 Tax=Parasitella parasitica TaxID=35722 RepID=A0A0B7NL95_9FUNG|nr:hypothetical protein [Parasitella parasitica]
MAHQETSNVSPVTGSLSPTSPRFIGPQLPPSEIPISDVISSTSRMSIDPDVNMDDADSVLEKRVEDPLAKLFKAVKAASINVEHARVKEAETLLDKHATSSELQEARQAVIEAEKSMIHIKSLLDHTPNQSVSETQHHHVKRTETDNMNSASAERTVVRDLPLFDLVNDDTKATSKGQFNTVAQFFKAFERMFCLQNVDVKKFWKDNLANVIETENADWYADTIEADQDMSYEAAKRIITSHFESPSKAINMFAKLVALKQKNEESVNDFSKRFIRTAHAAHVPGLEVNGPQANTSPDPSKSANNHGHKKETPKVKGENPGDKLSTSEMCHYCHKPWSKGHRCSEFLNFHKRNKSSAERHHVRSIHHMNECINKWTDFANSQSNNDHDKHIDAAIDSCDGKCRGIKQDYNNLSKRAIGLIDTGSEVSITIGQTEPIEVKYNGRTSMHRFEIIEFDDDNKTDVILGYEILPKLGIALTTGVAYNFDDNVIFDDSINDA